MLMFSTFLKQLQVRSVVTLCFPQRGLFLCRIEMCLFSELFFLLTWVYSIQAEEVDAFFSGTDEH